jgi:hypothetical protein
MTHTIPLAGCTLQLLRPRDTENLTLTAPVCDAARKPSCTLGRKGTPCDHTRWR